jgi:hypothetical protein
MFPKGKFNTDISSNAQYLALFRSPSDRKQIGIVGERMFDKNRVHFMNAYYKETVKPFGYLVVDNKPDTPAYKQVLGDLFDDCHVYLFATQTKENNTNVEPTPSHKPGRKQHKHHRYISWSDATIPEWQNYSLGASVTFPKDMLAQRCISHRAIVLILAIRVSTSAEKIIGLLK